MKEHTTSRENKGNILLIWDRMGDYHRARWKQLQKTLIDREVYAADLGRGDSLYKWEATEKASNYFLLTDEPVDEVVSIKAVSRFLALIHEKNIHYVCIPGYGRQVYLYMLISAKLKGIKVLLFAESWYSGSKLFDLVKGKVLNIFVDAFLVSGKRAEAHFYHQLHIPISKIFKGYSVVDNAHFHDAIESRNYSSKELLCIARYAEEKNLQLLINAFLKSDLIPKGWKLRLVGDGPLCEVLNAVVTAANADEYIYFDGWKSYEELPTLYARASCFVLPSLFEPWGLVVNEAMAAALPIIVSDQVGCQPDLVDAENGWVFPASDDDALVKVLNQLNNTTTSDLAQMGGVSADKIKLYGLITWVQQVSKGFKLITNQ